MGRTPGVTLGAALTSSNTALRLRLRVVDVDQTVRDRGRFGLAARSHAGAHLTDAMMWNMVNAEQAARWTSTLTQAAREGVVLRPGCELLRSAGLEGLPLPAEAVRSALISPDSDSSGTLSISRMTVQGRLDLSHVRWPGWLSIEESKVSGQLDLVGTHIGGLRLAGTAVEFLNAEEMKVDGSFWAPGLTSKRVCLRDARVTGSLHLRAARLLEMADGASIDLGGVQIGGSLDLRSVWAPAGVEASDARVTGALDLGESNLGSHNGIGLDVSCARIEGDLILAQCVVKGGILSHRLGVAGMIRSLGLRADQWQMDGARIAGGINLADASLPGGFQARSADLGMQFDLSGARLGSGDGIALGVEDSNITGALLLSDTLASGAISLARSRVGGPLIAQRASISSPSGIALSLDGAKLASSSFSECTFVGQVSAIELTCDAAMTLTGTAVEAPGSPALQFDGAVINGDLDLTGLVIRGQVCLQGCSVGGQFSAVGISIDHSGGPALVIDDARVGRDVLLTGSCLNEFVSATNTVCSGRLEMRGMKVSTARDLAITMRGSVVEQGVDARSLMCAGSVEMQRTKIKGGLILGDTSSDGVPSLNLAQASLDSLDLRLPSEKQTLDLRGCDVGVILVSGGQLHDWYPLWDATGVKIDDIRGASSSSAHRYVKWLDTIPRNGFSAQPWHELASWLERNGDPSGAKHFRYTAARRMTRSMPLWARPVRWLYAIAAGYGYYPLLAILWFAVLWIGAYLLVSQTPAAFHPTAALPAGATAVNITGSTACLDLGGYPCFDAVAYTNGVVSPVGWLHPHPWSPTDPAYSYVMWLASAIRTTGWVLSAVLLAGITGLLKKG